MFRRTNLKNWLVIIAFLLAVHVIPQARAGSIVSWGEQVAPNSELTCISAISTGRHHNLAIKADGSIVGWAWNHKGQATPPEGNDFVAISAGGTHSLAPEGRRQHHRMGV